MQWFEFFLGKEFVRFFLSLSMNPDIGHGLQPMAGGGIDDFVIGKFQALQKVLFYITDGVLHAAFFMWFFDSTGPDLKAVMIGKIQVARIEDNRIGGPAQHRHFAVIDPYLIGNPSKIFEGMLMAGKEVFHGLCQGELQIHFPAVSQHHDKERQAPPGGTDRDQTGITPIDLGTLTRFKVKGQKSRFGFGPDLADKLPGDPIPAGITTLLDLPAFRAGRAF